MDRNSLQALFYNNYLRMRLAVTGQNNRYLNVSYGSHKHTLSNLVGGIVVDTHEFVEKFQENQRKALKNRKTG
ncbi:DUF4023 domain-containing protein [Paenibacillus rhizoplanae]